MGVFQLDLFTVVVCSHMTLALMCFALFMTRPIPTQPTRTMRLWLMSVLAFLAAGMATSVAQRALNLPTFGPLAVSLVAFCLSLYGVLQWFALNDVAGPRTRDATIATVAIGTAGAAAVVPWLVGASLRPAWPAVIHVVSIVAVLPALRGMARQGTGGRALGVSLLLQLLPNAAMLLGLLDLQRGDLGVLVVGNLAGVFGATLSLLIWHQGRMEDLLARIAMTDALTGALNRHGLHQTLGRELARAQRHGSPLSVVLCDLDHFKRVNDTHGHAVGDQVLQRFVANAKQALRQGDCIGRWGGEEFLLVLPDTAAQHAVAVAERMRATPVTLPGVAPVTFSAGVATSGREDCGYDMGALLSCADKFLYVAKETRDRVVAAWATPGAAMPAVTRHAVSTRAAATAD